MFILYLIALLILSTSVGAFNASVAIGGITFAIGLIFAIFVQSLLPWLEGGKVPNPISQLQKEIKELVDNL